MVMIAAAIGAAVKWYGSRRDDADDDVQGDDPIVRALFTAVNRGELGELETCVHDGCRVSVNGIDITRNGQLESGFALFADAVHDLRAAFPDVRWELFDELTGKDEDQRKIAIRFVSTIEVDGETEETEVAGFGVVDDKQLVEWHQVVDMETYNRRRTQTGEDTVQR